MRFILVALSFFLSLSTISFGAEKPVKHAGKVRDLSQYIAIFDFDVVGKVDKDISRPLSDSVRNVVVRSGRYKVMDRANMDRILREQAFQMTGGVLKDKAVEAGQFLGVGNIVIGSIGIVGKTYMISLSMVNIESGETERVEEDTCKCELDELIESTKRTAHKLIAGGVAPIYEPTPEPEPKPKPKAKPVPPPPPIEEPVQIAPPTGVTYKDPVTGIEFALIKGGCFQMGEPRAERDERPMHEVCVDDFYIGRYEVTQAQWKTLKGKNPSKYKKNEMNPVEDMSWKDIQDFVRDLNQKAGRYYRLPTEAEWEYAASGGGQKEKWAGTNTESEIGSYAWNNDNVKRGEHQPVGQKKPNRLGLYDMTGNVAEWVMDRYDNSYYKESPRSNPSGPERGSDYVYRGGSYKDDPKDCRTTKRAKKSSSKADSTIGFRLAFPAR